MAKYDIAVIGAGPAGMIAAIRAGQLNKRVVLLEKNDSVGRKILITGKGRCNLTNSGKQDIFIEKFGKTGQFLRTALSRFSNEDLMEFFKSRHLELKIERQGRVFPVTDSARSVTSVLVECLKENNVDIRYKARIEEIKKDKEGFALVHGQSLDSAKKVILATGGASYRDTGSSGEGFQFAKKLGHTIIALRPGLVPLKVKEEWVKELQGLTLKNISIVFVAGKKKICSEVGELLLTHFGVSGPLILDLSGEIAHLLDEHKEMGLFIDLKPGIKTEEMEDKLLREFKEHGGKEVKNMLSGMLPLRLVPTIIKMASLNANKKVHQISKDERRALARVLKALPLTITGTLPIEEAMVTCGGVSTKEINPRTMESKIVPGLYFAGEVIEGGAPSGGYNLQQAFSTGYLAGESAANA
ncbi:MAG: NAD(P)/FAD-dependent oxidoreductase [Candidatus Omnitrophota bacterium]|nr:NAD(P)/FAD-dependent oxidoreductase [Candidatus Omnitrophota bacterium]